MAISKKGKRKIMVDSENYLWWVFNEEDQTAFDGNQIKIVKENQVGYFKYGLCQSSAERFVVVSLREEKYRIHMCCPKFEDENKIIKPSEIAKLIRWSLDKKKFKNRIFVHGYNSSIGIISEEDRLKTLEMIMDKFQKSK